MQRKSRECNWPPSLPGVVVELDGEKCEQGSSNMLPRVCAAAHLPNGRLDASPGYCRDIRACRSSQPHAHTRGPYFDIGGSFGISSRNIKEKTDILQEMHEFAPTELSISVNEIWTIVVLYSIRLHHVLLPPTSTY